MKSAHFDGNENSSQCSASALCHCSVQPAFWVLDLMARYQVNQKLSVNLNIRNALDSSYFAGMRDFGRVQYTWGAPRSVTASVRYDF
ncbi:TonB-dependent receptor [Comamonas piscis]|uniref:TonB-dependent receptor n=1 Tax=Comamonas piscis TaxID=1562974 RepID=A0A7G5EHU5_9BURK|nr:TonB-dependent receptor [Comamonas piscis]